MTMAMNDVAVQNMLLLIANILPHKTCLKPRGKIVKKGAKKKIASTHEAPTLVDLCIYLELNKTIVVRCPCEILLTWQKYTVVRVYLDMAS